MGDGFWFAFITATTVGYGDKRPETKIGRYINSFVMCVDVLVIGFALGLIVEFIAASAQKANSRSILSLFSFFPKRYYFIEREIGGAPPPCYGEENHPRGLAVPKFLPKRVLSPPQARNNRE